MCARDLHKIRHATNTSRVVALVCMAPKGLEQSIRGP